MAISNVQLGTFINTHNFEPFHNSKRNSREFARRSENVQQLFTKPILIQFATQILVTKDTRLLLDYHQLHNIIKSDDIT